MPKFNNKKVTFAGHTFDSKAELAYYKKLLRLQAAGKVEAIQLQPVFLLQEGFLKNGVEHKKITYIADFRVYYTNGKVDIVDVKGVETEVFRIKRKLFEYRYPELHLNIIDSGGVTNGRQSTSKTNTKRTRTTSSTKTKKKQAAKGKATYRKSK